MTLETFIWFGWMDGWSDIWVGGFMDVWMKEWTDDSFIHVVKNCMGGTLSATFWCLCQKLSLSPLYLNKTLLHKSSERSSLVSGPRLNSPPGAKNPGVFVWFNNNLSSWGLIQDPSGQDGPDNLCEPTSADSKNPESAVWSSRQCLPVLGSLLCCIPQLV